MSQFIFLGEALAFDFVNTEIVARRKQIDLLDAPDDLINWWNAVSNLYQMNVGVNHETAEAAFKKAKKLRGALRRMFTAVVEGEEIIAEDVNLLNEILSAGHTHLEVMPDNRFGVHQVSD